MALGALPPMVPGTGVEFGGDDRGQDGTLEDPGVLAQPEKALSPAGADVNAGIEHQRARWQRNHLFFVRARPKTSSGPPGLRRFCRTWRPASTARRSSITRLTASELLRDWRALRSRCTFPTSSKRFVRVNAADSWGFTPLPLPEQRPATANHSDIHALIGVADALVLIG